MVEAKPVVVVDTYGEDIMTALWTEIDAMRSEIATVTTAIASLTTATAAARVETEGLRADFAVVTEDDNGTMKLRTTGDGGLL